MKRRSFLRSLALAALALSPSVRAAAARAARVPRNIVALIGKRTRPLTDSQLHEPHDLAG